MFWNKGRKIVVRELVICFEFYVVFFCGFIVEVVI